MTTSVPGHDQVISHNAKGPYSSAIESNGTLYLAGQGGLTPEGTIVEGGIRAETRTTLANIRDLMENAGWSTDDLTQITCYLVDIGEWGQLNEEYAAFFGDGPVPTRTAVGVAALPLGLRVEMTCIASRREQSRKEAS